MQPLISQVMLPIALACIMLVIGLELKSHDFRQVLSKPKVVLLGLGLQIFILPLIALFLSLVIPLEPMACAGLLLVSLCPGGATSNVFTYLAKGDIALSIVLTAIASLASPILLPITFNAYLQLFGETSQQFTLPLLTTIKQLSCVTLLPIIIGMSVRHVFPVWATKASPALKKIATSIMITLVITLTISHIDIIGRSLNYNALAAILLSMSAFFFAYQITRRCQIPKSAQRTITIETGVQNAGTAMMVAFSVMHTPELANIPLIYGLLMNIPAGAFVIWITKQYPSNSDHRD